jgi:hypothetical protein
LAISSFSCFIFLNLQHRHALGTIWYTYLIHIRAYHYTSLYIFYRYAHCRFYIFRSRTHIISKNGFPDILCVPWSMFCGDARLP